MSKRAAKRMQRSLAARQRAHSPDSTGATTKPGSLNRKKGVGKKARGDER